MKHKVVIDTNIVFSAILNPGSRIGKIIIGSRSHFQFYTCNFLRVELIKHRKKLLQLTKLSGQELDELEFVLTKNIIFINEGLLPHSTLIDTECILTDIDINDTPFVALTKHLKAKLWTGDKVLSSGLLSKNFIEVFSTTQLSDLLDKLERK